MDDDYEDYSYYSKPRLKLAAVPAKSDANDPEDQPSQALKAIYCSFGVGCLAVALLTSGVAQFVLIWFALAFVVGPFSPSRVTGGNCKVGQGEVVDFDPEEEAEGENLSPSPAQTLKGSGLSKTTNGPVAASVVAGAKAAAAAAAGAGAGSSKGALSVKSDPGKGGWSRADWDQLRALLVKYPRGTAKRWENVGRGLSSKKSMEEVIAAAKFMTESSHKDAHAAYVAQFGAPEQSADTTAEPVVPGAKSKRASQWSDELDKALLKALKECPKGDPQRWEKVAQDVPGRTRAECQKRLAELRDALKAKKTANGDAVADDDAI